MLRDLWLSVGCGFVAWALALARFGLALFRHEHGVDAALAGVLSAVLPCLGVIALLNAHIRRSKPTNSEDVVPIRAFAAPSRTKGRGAVYNLPPRRDAERHS